MKAQIYTISQMAKQFNLSRSTLLYYDAIGLLIPSSRSPANYRLYSEKDFGRMEKINTLRQTGLSLDKIAEILKSGQRTFSSILEHRLNQLNQEINALRGQQQIIVTLLKADLNFKKTRILNKKQWVSLLKASGLGEEAMGKWHVEFERMSPEAHQDFLESLGLPEEEIKRIRKQSKQNDHTGEAALD